MKKKMDNYNYPMGSDTEDAPWNQCEPKEIEVTCDVSFFLQKKVIVETTNYIIENCEEDGSARYELLDSYKDIEELVQQNHNSIIELLGELAKYIQGELLCGNISKERKWKLKGMLEDCQKWEKENIEVEDFYIH